jgi:nitroimidazol reductase NimA-like FMN-containing flavoprotein (pyridoxamine 5'-phosphate oxidase superfamily)
MSPVRTVTNLRSERTTVRRLPDRGSYGRAEAEAVLDEALICHIGFVVDGQPYVIPTIHARDGGTIYVHGSPASRMLRTLRGGIEVCLTVTIVDGLVVARSAFHHSMNYRSVVVLGRAVEIADLRSKASALEAITNHVLAGRWDEVRPVTDKELRSTTVLALRLAEASVKTRTGPPLDDDDDYGLPIWAGVVPLTIVPGRPVPDPRLISGVGVPLSVANYPGDGRERRDLSPNIGEGGGGGGQG